MRPMTKTEQDGDSLFFHEQGEHDSRRWTELVVWLLLAGIVVVATVV